MTEPVNRPQADAPVLHAIEAPTEVRLDQAQPPAYYIDVDVSDGTAHRRPIVPHPLQRPHIRRTLACHAEAGWYHARYHGIRAPFVYLPLTLWWAVVGLFRVGGRVIKWWHATDLYQLEHQAAADGLLTDHLRIHKAGRETRTARGTLVALASVVAIIVVLLMVRFAPWYAWGVFGLAALPVLARHGRPAGKPIVQSAVLPAAVQPPSQDVITRGLGSLGIAGIDRWLRDGHELVFPSPVREDGPGWRAEVDLPYGVRPLPSRCPCGPWLRDRQDLETGL
jgi:DNA segregation ATPase FtsK/SpoIIIE, S-DNA-T family